MTEDHDHLGSINSFDPVNIHVMTSHNPEYISTVQDVINGGGDEDVHGVFNYVFDEDDDDPNAAVIRNLSPPDHEHGLMVSMTDLRTNPNYWVCDTGASGPSCVHDKGLIKVRDLISDEMYGNNGSTLPIVKRFDMAGTVYDKHTKLVSSIVLRGVNHVPSSTFNLFSVAQSLKTGWKFYGKYQGFVLTKGSARIIFDIRIPSGSGYLWATTIVPSTTAGIHPEVTNFSGVAEKSDKNTLKSKPSDTKNNDASLTKNDDVLSSAPAVLSQSGGKAPYMCNGITKEYAHMLLGHVRSALTTVKYLNFRACHDPLKCRQIVACEGCARGNPEKKVSASETRVHTSNPQKRMPSFILMYQLFGRRATNPFGTMSGLL